MTFNLPNGVEPSDVILPNGNPASEIRTPDGTTRWTAIPASEADQKLIHRWYLSEASAPFIDQVGTADSTSVTGTTQVTGGYVDDAARDGDGVDDYISTTTLGDFGGTVREGGDFAYAFTIVPSNVTDDCRLCGVANSSFGNGQLSEIRLARGGNSGEIKFREHDANDNRMTVRTGTGLMTNGEPYRIVCNAVGNDASNWEIYVNQTDETLTADDNGGLSNCENWNYDYTLFADNSTGTREFFADVVIDDFCIFNDSLTPSEAQSYTNPWS